MRKELSKEDLSLIIGGNDALKTLGELAYAGARGGLSGGGVGAAICGGPCAVVGAVYGIGGGIASKGIDLAR